MAVSLKLKGSSRRGLDRLASDFVRCSRLLGLADFSSSNRSWRPWTLRRSAAGCTACGGPLPPPSEPACVSVEGRGSDVSKSDQERVRLAATAKGNRMGGEVRKGGRERRWRMVCPARRDGGGSAGERERLEKEVKSSDGQRG